MSSYNVHNYENAFFQILLRDLLDTVFVLMFEYSYFVPSKLMGIINVPYLLFHFNNICNAKEILHLTNEVFK